MFMTGAFLTACLLSCRAVAQALPPSPPSVEPALDQPIAAPAAVVTMNSSTAIGFTQVGGSRGRPADLFYPPSCGRDANSTGSCPVVMVLHAFGSNGSFHADYLRVTDNMEEFGYALLLPDGTLNSEGYRWWNGPECCNTEDTDVDDLGYLSSILMDAQRLLNVDGIYVVGHSNGGNMANLLACNTSLVSGLVSIAGFKLPAGCHPRHAVSVLLVHGTADNIVLFESSEEALAGWLEVDRCPSTASPLIRSMRDYDCDSTMPVGRAGYLDEWRDANCELAGNETTVAEYGPCSSSTRVTFWKMEGAGHVPSFNDVFGRDMMSTLLRDWLGKTGKGGVRRRGLRAY